MDMKERDHRILKEAQMWAGMNVICAESSKGLVLRKAARWFVGAC